MQTSAAVRQHVEAALAHRMAAPLTTRERPVLARLACGAGELDELLGGGLPVGVVTELTGAASSGRTTLAMAYVAAAAREGCVCAWIDVADALDPESAAANGVDLERLLWVRCGEERKSPATADGKPPETRPVAAAAPAPAAGLSAGAAGPAAAGPPATGLPVRGGGSPHPRAEGQGMPQAVSAMLAEHSGIYNHHLERQVRRERKIIGTPGAPNRPLVWRSADREEQVGTDRVPGRRQKQNLAAAAGAVAVSAGCAEPQRKQAGGQPTDMRLAHRPLQPLLPPAQAPRAPASPWSALDQALKCADLLLQAGGFSVIVLDLGDTAPEFALRIPMATWFRFRGACERTQVSLLLLTQQSCARSSAELVVRLETGHMTVESRVMTGIRFPAAAERAHRSPARVVSIRKPPQPERGTGFSSRAHWACGVG